jgi:hypothetical protein
MATYSIYTYIIWEKVSHPAEDSGTRSRLFYKDSDDFKKSLTGSISIEVTSSDWPVRKYLYDTENDILHTSWISEDTKPRECKSYYSIKSFMEMLSVLPRFRCFIVTPAWLPELFLHHKKEILDWSKTITDLSTIGVVKTSPSKNIMSSDGRKFWFENQPEETAIDVDCLGILLHFDLTNKVQSSWRTNFKNNLVKN